MHEFAEVQAGELRLGATLTIGTYALPAIPARFVDRHPGLMVQVEIENTAVIAQRTRVALRLR